MGASTSRGYGPASYDAEVKKDSAKKMKKFCMWVTGICIAFIIFVVLLPDPKPSKPEEHPSADNASTDKLSPEDFRKFIAAAGNMDAALRENPCLAIYLQQLGVKKADGTPSRTPLGSPVLDYSKPVYTVDHAMICPMSALSSVLANEQTNAAGCQVSQRGLRVEAVRMERSFNGLPLARINDRMFTAELNLTNSPNGEPTIPPYRPRP